MAEVDCGEGRCLAQAGIEDDEIPRVAGGIDDKPDEPAFVFAGPGCAGTKTNSPGGLERFIKYQAFPAYENPDGLLDNADTIPLLDG